MMTFCHWLCNRAEQDYWEYCDSPRSPRPAVTFNYNNKGVFIGNNTIRTKSLVREPPELGPVCTKCASENTFIEHDYVGYTTWICRDCNVTNIQHHERDE